MLARARPAPIPARPTAMAADRAPAVQRHRFQAEPWSGPPDRVAVEGADERSPGGPAGEQATKPVRAQNEPERYDRHDDRGDGPVDQREGLAALVQPEP